MSFRRDAMTSATAASIDVVVLVLLAGCFGAEIADNGVVRGMLVLVCGTFVPGWALLTRVPATDLITTAALAVALSLTVDAIGSLFMGWIGFWHPAALGAVLAIGSVLLVGTRLATFLRSPRTGTEGSTVGQ